MKFSAKRNKTKTLRSFSKQAFHETAIQTITATRKIQYYSCIYQKGKKRDKRKLSELLVKRCFRSSVSSGFTVFFLFSLFSNYDLANFKDLQEPNL